MLGQLWALTVALEAYLLGHPIRRGSSPGSLLLSFAAVLLLVVVEPAQRSGRRRPGRR